MYNVLTRAAFTAALLFGGPGLSISACGGTGDASASNTQGAGAGGVGGAAASGASQAVGSGGGHANSVSSSGGSSDVSAGSGAANGGASASGPASSGAANGGASASGPASSSAANGGASATGPASSSAANGGASATGPASSATGGVGVGGSGGATDVMCNKHSPTAFPTFDRSCSGDTSCVAVVHRTDCCGTQVATGINTSELTRFNTDEAICDSQYPACGCAGGPETTDSGQTVTVAGSVQVACQQGVCTTFIP